MVGKLLVARPSLLGDPSFGRSVVIMAEQHESGSLGFVVNHPIPYSMKGLLPDFKVDTPIFQGGPVNQDRLFYIHKLANLSNTKALGNGLFWGGDLSELENALDTGMITQDEVRFFVGYAGWEKNQLEQECKDNSWLLVKNNYDVFSAPTSLWSKILSDLGGSLALYASAPSHPGLN